MGLGVKFRKTPYRRNIVLACQLMQERLIENIVRLRRTENEVADASLRHDLAQVRELLEELAGPTVKPAAAARLLGISQPGLRRWLDRGRISTVLTPAGRREVPLAELVSLLEAVERRDRRGRVLGRVLEERERAASELDFDKLLPRRVERTPHRRPELISLAYHRLLAERLTDELVERSRQQLHRWSKTGKLDPRWLRSWEDVLSRSTREIAETISDDTIELAQLRQSSPFAGLLSEPERRRIVETVTARLR